MGEKELVPPEYRVPFIFVGISVMTLVVAIFLVIKNTQSVEPIRFSSDEKVSSESSKLVIDVSGAVKNPGVYNIVQGSRVSDAIVMAGGFSDEADMDAVALRINQASVLSDGAKVYIPKKEQGGQISGSSSLSHFVSINSASQSDIEALSGIGPVTAKKIIDNRPYAKLEDLVVKKAIGQSLFDKLKNQLTL